MSQEPPDEPLFLSQAEFARRRGVSKMTVTKWKAKGLLVLDAAGKVNVDETEWKLDDRPPVYRGGVTHQTTRPIATNERPDLQAQLKAKRKPEPAPRSSPRDNDEPDGDEEEGFDPSGQNLPLPEAIRRKENFLGLLRKHEHEVALGEWVRVEDVASQVEREYATVRERLLTIPGKISALLVGADRATIEATILREVTEALHELHDPAGIAGRVGAGDPAAEGEARP